MLILVVSGQAKTNIDLTGTNYYLFLARGPTSGNNLNEHDQELSSSNPLNFTVVGPNIEGKEDHAGYKVLELYLQIISSNKSHKLCRGLGATFSSDVEQSL